VVIEPEKGIVLPAVWIESQQKQAAGPVIVYLNDKGKSTLANEEIILRTLLDKGCRLFAVDLRGTGETAPGMEGKFWDFLAGKPIFGQRVADVRTVVRWLSRSGVDDNRVYVWAKGNSAIYAAMAGALEQNIAGMVLEEPLLAFEQAVTTKIPAYRHEIILPGVLEKLDLPHVYRALCPMSVTLINPVAGDKSSVSRDQADEIYQQVSDTYKSLGKSGNWSVQTNLEDGARSQAVLSALL
jgi:pimeloyl-ACP methyl ester carboxylesterase